MYDNEEDELSESPNYDEDGDALSHFNDVSGADDEDSFERDLDDRKRRQQQGLARERLRQPSRNGQRRR